MGCVFVCVHVYMHIYIHAYIHICVCRSASLDLQVAKGKLEEKWVANIFEGQRDGLFGGQINPLKIKQFVSAVNLTIILEEEQEGW